jgi:hypothetical protein
MVPERQFNPGQNHGGCFTIGIIGFALDRIMQSFQKYSLSVENFNQEPVMTARNLSR